jgi:hypothetical protein
VPNTRAGAVRGVVCRVIRWIPADQQDCAPLGLPIGGIVALLLLLMRLGLLNFGERSSATVQHWQPNTAVQGPQPVSPPSAAPPSQRLQELEALRTSGAISDTEYAERRAGIISGI